jgi:hypothetical protein
MNETCTLDGFEIHFLISSSDAHEFRKVSGNTIETELIIHEVTGNDSKCFILSRC